MQLSPEGQSESLEQVLVVGMQVPARQLSPVGHMLPQPPQLLGSEETSAQLPPHRSSPEGQTEPWQTPLTQLSPEGQSALLEQALEATQTPLEQVSPAGQAVAQLPQLLGSVKTLAQVPPHRSSPEGQTVPWHTPPTQLSPEGQSESVEHALGTTQTPLEQESPAGQAIWQPPQLFGSWLTSTHRAPHWV
jgi:hypothetical protein